MLLDAAIIVDYRSKCEQTYSIGAGVLLLRGDDGSAPLGLVQSALALDDRLTRSGCSPAPSTRADLGNCIPVVAHCDGGRVVEKESGVMWDGGVGAVGGLCPSAY